MAAEFLLTTESAPSGFSIEKVFGLIQFTTAMKLGRGGADAEAMQAALDMLAEAAPAEANAVIGVRLSTAAVSSDDGMVVILTYIGTPAIISEIE